MSTDPDVKDTLPEWLWWRYGVGRENEGWKNLTEGDRLYWSHEADAIRRAVARNGFKVSR